MKTASALAANTLRVSVISLLYLTFNIHREIGGELGGVLRSSKSAARDEKGLNSGGLDLKQTESPPLQHRNKVQTEADSPNKPHNAVDFPRKNYPTTPYLDGYSLLHTPFVPLHTIRKGSGLLFRDLPGVGPARLSDNSKAPV